MERNKFSPVKKPNAYDMYVPMKYNKFNKTAFLKKINTSYE